MSSLQQDAAFMQLALDLGAQAAAAGEVPVGAVVVKDGQVVGVGRNSPIASADPSAHAEVLALRDAAKNLGNYRLDDCTLYVTLEPCAMCCGAMLHARLKRVVFGAKDEKTGCAGSVVNLFSNAQLNHQTQVEGGVMADQAAVALQRFFQDKRALQRINATPLREDALRTPDACFDHLPQFPWQAHFTRSLPVLDGLRMHFLDEGPRDAANVVLCMHPVPGWSYVMHAHIAAWLGQGARVLAPDLIGFGKSDKPKRQEFHTPEFHLQSVLQLLESLNIDRLKLVLTTGDNALTPRLLTALAHRVGELLFIPRSDGQYDPHIQPALDAPFPDAGHRAAERAFASKAFR